MSGFRFLLLSTAALAIGLSAAHAQDEGESSDVSDVIVVDDPIFVTATGYGVPEDQLGNSTSVITREEIEEQHFRTLPDALRTLPGLSVVQSGPQGTQTSVFTRGGNSNQTLILLNGRPIGDPSTPNGQIDLANIPLDNVERIEVVRGPAASLYGSQAQAGVINIITRRGEGEPTVTAKAEFGTQSTYNQSINANGVYEGIGFDATFTHLSFGGFDITPERNRPAGVAAEDDAFREFSGGLALDADLNEQLSGFFNFNIVDSRIETDVAPEDPNSEQSNLYYFVSGGVEGSLYEGFWQPRLTLGYDSFKTHATNEPDSLSPNFSDTTFKGNRIDVAFVNNLFLSEMNTVTLGLEFHDETFSQTGFSNFGGFVIRNDSDASRYQFAGFAQHRLNYNDFLFLTSHVRYDIVEATENAVTFSVTPLVKIKETGTSIHGSVGTGYRAPSLFELFGFSPTSAGTAFRGNPDLEATRSFSWEIGVQQAVFDDEVLFGATYFNNSFKDGVVTVFDSSFNSTTVANQDFDAQGVETFIQLEPNDQLYFRFDYTFTDTDVKDTTPSQALRRPKHQFNSTFAMDVTDYLQLTGNLLTVGGRQDIGLMGGFINPKPYTVVNAAANVTITENLEFYVQGNNLLNEEYEPADGFAGPGAQAIFGIRGKI